jgi:uncharacterized protein YegP (UPF0339 family)
MRSLYKVKGKFRFYLQKNHGVFVITILYTSADTNRLGKAIPVTRREGL